MPFKELFYVNGHFHIMSIGFYYTQSERISHYRFLIQSSVAHYINKLIVIQILSKSLYSNGGIIIFLFLSKKSNEPMSHNHHR